jgi:Ca-activated chloride channel family protein
MKTIQKLCSKLSARFFFALGLFALCCSLLVLTYNGHAQSQDNTRQRVAANPTPTPPTNPKASPTPDDIPIDEGDVERVETELVNLNVRVVDRNNRPVNDVKKEEFKVYEDGVEQEVFNVLTEEVPISYGIAIDHSGSLRSQLQTVIEAGNKIISSNKEGDATFLVGFVSSDKIELLSDFSADKNLLNETLEQLVTEGGQTAIIDAVYLAAEKAANYKKGDPLSDKRRRALIVVTDGEDKSNSYTEKELFEYLREEDVQIYVIGFVNELDTEKSLIRGSKRDKAVKLINRLATETGGKAYLPNSLDELPRIAEEITKDLRTQYVVSYYPSNKTKDGKFRPIRVTVADVKGRDKRIAITKQGRVATPELTPSKPDEKKTDKNQKP